MALFLGMNDYSPAELKTLVLEVSTKDTISGVPTNTLNNMLYNHPTADLYF